MKLSTGVHQMEWWVSGLQRPVTFYGGLLELIGWRKISDRAFFAEASEIYFYEKPGLKVQEGLGIRLLCISATRPEEFCKVAAYLKNPALCLYGGQLK